MNFELARLVDDLDSVFVFVFLKPEGGGPHL